MIRALALSVMLCGPAMAQGLSLSDEGKAAFGAEVRAAILADPTPIARALDPQRDLYADDVAADRARLEGQSALFRATPRGYGAEDPRLTIVFFETYPCLDCATAWAEVEALMAAHPDIRVEPRFADGGAAAQLLLSILDHRGAAAYRTARARLMQAQTEADLDQAMRDGEWPQDRMLRPAPRTEAAAFTALELEMTPSFVFPQLMVQGAVPRIVLEKYLTE